MSYSKYIPSENIKNLKDVVEVSYISDNDRNQTIIEMNSGRKISIICNFMSYGHKQGLLEMSIITSQGNIINKEKVEGWDDVVKGYMTNDDVEKEIPRLVKIYGRKLI